MISFQPTDEQEVVREAMHEFAETAMRPLARDCDEASKIPEEFLAKAWDLGLVGTQVPEAFGGAGEARSPVTNAIVLEELAWGDASLALAAIAPAGFAFAVADQGSDEQKRELLPPFGGESYRAGALALAEPGPTFDPRAPQTRAEAKARGYRLSGTKCLVPMGDRASHFLVSAAGERGTELFVVPRDAAGLTIQQPEKNLGLRALPTATLRLDGVEVAAADRLGGAAGSDPQRAIDRARVALAALMTGLSRAVLDYAVPYAKERVSFGKPIAQKQAIAFRLAEMHIEIESMRWLCWKAASRLEQGQVATRDAHLARDYAARQAMWIADHGVQVLGGHGFIREHPVEMWYRNARTLGVLEGAVSV